MEDPLLVYFAVAGRIAVAVDAPTPTVSAHTHQIWFQLIDGDQSRAEEVLLAVKISPEAEASDDRLKELCRRLIGVRAVMQQSVERQIRRNFFRRAVAPVRKQRQRSDGLRQKPNA